MKRALLACFLAAMSLAHVLSANAADTRFYELRTYYVAPGKAEALKDRFRNHTLALFEKHGMKNLGYWIPVDKNGTEEPKLVFLLSYPSREARDASWKAFMADPVWVAAYKASEANGPLVQKVENPFLAATPYSPEIKPGKAEPARIFELRTYKTPEGRLQSLHDRFRDHTVKLFEKHGMTNFGYWTPVDEKNGASDTLVYILAHKSREAAAASFKAFRDDPGWIAARKASEEQAGGSLTVPNGVQSVFMVPADFSPTR